jgi:hypothetical protein
MHEESVLSNRSYQESHTLEEYFIYTGFHDLLRLALEIARNLGFNQTEMIEAICMVNDKFYKYPPTKNRTAWFQKVFEEKLHEARGDILTFRAKMKYLGK